MILGEVKALAVETFREWRDDDAMQWGAALSYYAALALAPLLVTLLALSGILLDEDAAQREILDFVSRRVGEQGETVARTILDGREGGLFAGVSSGVLLLVGATGVFAQLQKALNELWGVAVAGSIRRFLLSRVMGFLMVLGIGVLILAGLALQAVVAALPTVGGLDRLLNIGGSTALFTVVFAAVYKVLPDVDIRWTDVWVGAAVTATLFTMGQFLVGLYLGRSSVGSSYGAAGSLVAVLVWLYYSAHVFFFGAEFTQVWSRRHGRRICPVPGAKRVHTRKVAPGEADGGAAVTGTDDARRPGSEEGRKGGPPPRRRGVRGGASYP